MAEVFIISRQHTGDYVLVGFVEDKGHQNQGQKPVSRSPLCLGDMVIHVLVFICYLD